LIELYINLVTILIGAEKRTFLNVRVWPQLFVFGISEGQKMIILAKIFLPYSNFYKNTAIFDTFECAENIALKSD